MWASCLSLRAGTSFAPPFYKAGLAICLRDILASANKHHFQESLCVHSLSRLQKNRMLLNEMLNLDWSFPFTKNFWSNKIFLVSHHFEICPCELTKCLMIFSLNITVQIFQPEVKKKKKKGKQQIDIYSNFFFFLQPSCIFTESWNS